MKCNKIICNNEAKLRPVLLLYTPKEDNQNAPARLTLDIPVCPTCAGTAKVSDFVGDGAWAQITAWIKNCGKPVPDRNRTLLAWETLNRPFEVGAANAPTTH
jgi:hypothetical protein